MENTFSGFNRDEICDDPSVKIQRIEEVLCNGNIGLYHIVKIL